MVINEAFLFKSMGDAVVELSSSLLCLHHMPRIVKDCYHIGRCVFVPRVSSSYILHNRGHVTVLAVCRVQ